MIQRNRWIRVSGEQIQNRDGTEMNRIYTYTQVKQAYICIAKATHGDKEKMP